jgi:hypothetical protein
VKRGDRVSWSYGGKRVYGTVTGTAGARGEIKGPSGGKVVRVGSKDDPVIRIKHEGSGNPVLKKRSELRAAPKRK